MNNNLFADSVQSKQLKSEQVHRGKGQAWEITPELLR